MLWGDSQTVINQMRGIYPIVDEDIWDIHMDIANIIKEYGLDIHFRWVPRGQNRQADKLSKTKEKVRIHYPSDREFLVDVKNSPARGNLRRKIAIMNSTPFPTNAMFKRLHPSSKDILSGKKLFELQQMAGREATEIVAGTFPGKHTNNKHHQAQALRWMLRGLAMDLAMKKVKFDIHSRKKNSGNENTLKTKGKQSSKKKTASTGKVLNITLTGGHLFSDRHSIFHHVLF
ncbi:MAG: reverse transcriptase-like protein [Methanolobus sp.]